MKVYTASALLAFNLAVGFHAVAANNVILNFTGNIKASPCSVSNLNPISIDLNTIYAGTFNDVQTGSEWKSFNIKLINCSSNMSQVTLTFTGESDNADVNSLYKNQGTATNLAVQLQGGIDGKPLGNQQKMTVSMSNQTSIDIPLKVRAYSLSGGVMPGTILANITSTITYL